MKPCSAQAHHRKFIQVHSSTRSRVEKHPDPHGDVTPEWKHCRPIVFIETFQSWDTKKKKKPHRRTGHTCRLEMTRLSRWIKRRSHWENYQENIGPIGECVQETMWSITGHCFHCPGDKTLWILSPHISATKKVDKRQKTTKFPHSETVFHYFCADGNFLI